MNILNLREADSLEVTVLVDNYVDGLLESTEVARRARPPYPQGLLAENGLSCLIKVCAGSEEHFVLMDAGMSATCLFHNANLLEVDFGKVESAVLSHGHFDHFIGLIPFLNNAQKGTSLTLHPDVFLERRMNNSSNEHFEYLPNLDEIALRETGVALHKIRETSVLASNLVLVTGQVARVTSFEKGLPFAEARIDGKWVVDSFYDDQAIAVNIKSKGLVIISGCSHAGIINTVKYTQKTTQTDKVHAVMGGFHLCGPLFKPIVGPTVAEMKKIAPDFVIPMHCTGWNTSNQFATEMPEQFVLNSVGTTYVFA